MTAKRSSLTSYAIVIFAACSHIVPFYGAMAQSQEIPTLPGIEEATEPQGNVNVQQLPERANDQATDMPPADQLEAATTVPQQTIEELNKAYEDDNIFYDADQLVPSGEFLKKGSTTKNNPQTQPASKLIIVNKNHSGNSTDAMLVSAGRASALGRHESALAIYDQLYRKNKRDPRILMGRAVELQNLERYDEALLAYEEFLKRRPDDVNAQINMLGLMAQKYPAVSLQHLLDLHQKNERHVGLIAQIAVTYGQLQRYEEAMKFFGIAAGIEPDNPVHYFNMAIVADKAGSKDDAIALYEKALEIDALHGSGAIPRESIYERLASLR